MLNKSFTTVTAKSTIVTYPAVTIKTTPVYPVFNGKNLSSFSLGDGLPMIVNIDDQEYVSYPLKPNTESNLIVLSALEDKDLTACLETGARVKDVSFYIGDDPFGETIPYTPEFIFRPADNDSFSLLEVIDDEVWSHGPNYVIKGRMKGELRLDTGSINVWMENVSVTDLEGNDFTKQFHFTGYNVVANKSLSIPNNK